MGWRRWRIIAYRFVCWTSSNVNSSRHYLHRADASECAAAMAAPGVVLAPIPTIYRPGSGNQRDALDLA